MWYILYFLAFIIIGSQFFVNLFVGVVTNTFNKEKERLGKNYLLTDTQKEWIRVTLMGFKAKPIREARLTSSRVRNFFIKIANHSLFDTIILISIMLNTFVLAFRWYGEPSFFPVTNEILNYIFAGIFTVEAIIKISAFGKSYFWDGWNIFDFAIVSGTVIIILIELALPDSVKLGA